MDDPHFQAARDELERLAADERTPFERGHVFPAELEASRGAVAIYCAGTYNEPVILIDLAAHAGDLRQIRKSVAHEIVHAIQEADWDGIGELRFDEDEAAELEL